MKIGIITFSSAHNYGAVLQAWATQTYLEKQGHQVEIINLRLNVIDNVYKIAVNKKYTGNKYVNAVLNQARKVKRCIVDPEKYKRYRTFERFINQKLHTTKVYHSSKELKEDLSLEYDALIAGSDQIWNSSLTKVLAAAYFLDFGKKDTKRISYAASIGRKELPKSETELVRHYLRNIDYISVREINAWKAINPLTEKEVEIVADPTFLLEREDFDKLKQTFPVKQPYIYVHNVHLAKQDLRLFEMAEELSQKTGLPIVANRKDEAYSNVAARFTSGNPEQFIGVISEAEYVVTNSFHATVFALIYHRNFITIPHITNPDRMQNLLGELGIANHLLVSKNEIPADLSEFRIDYDAVEKRKAKMRENSVMFLERALYGPKTEHPDTLFRGVAVSQENEGAKDVQEKYLVSPRRKQVYQEQALCDVLVSIMEFIQKKEGKCAFPIFDTDMKLIYTVTDNIKMLERLAVPEIFETEMGDTQEKIKKLLESGRQVMFVGSACRILALKQYLGREYPNLLSVEILGHGVCDSRVFDGYRQHLEEEYKSSLVMLEMNNQFRKPDEFFTVSNFASGSVKVEKNTREPFHLAYRRHQVQQLPCFFCKIRNGAAGKADMVLGQWSEYKDIEGNEKYKKFYGEKECVVFSAPTEKGRNIWKEISGAFDIYQLDIADCGVRELTITQKYLDAMQMMKEGKKIYEVLLELRKPRKKK